MCEMQTCLLVVVTSNPYKPLILLTHVESVETCISAVHTPNAAVDLYTKFGIHFDNRYASETNRRSLT